MIERYDNYYIRQITKYETTIIMTERLDFKNDYALYVATVRLLIIPCFVKHLIIANHSVTSTL